MSLSEREREREKGGLTHTTNQPTKSKRLSHKDMEGGSAGEINVNVNVKIIKIRFEYINKPRVVRPGGGRGGIPNKWRRRRRK